MASITLTLSDREWRERHFTCFKPNSYTLGNIAHIINYVVYP